MTHTYAEGSNSYNFFDSPSASWLVIINIMSVQTSFEVVPREPRVCEFLFFKKGCLKIIFNAEFSGIWKVEYVGPRLLH